jgi:DNA-binding XRE family transcriptional regulator
MGRRKVEVENFVSDFLGPQGFISEVELAKRVGVTRSFLYKLKRHRTSCSVGLALRLAEVLDVPVAQLFRLAPDVPPGGVIKREGSAQVGNTQDPDASGYLRPDHGDDRASSNGGAGFSGTDLGAGDDLRGVSGDVDSGGSSPESDTEGNYVQ